MQVLFVNTVLRRIEQVAKEKVASGAFPDVSLAVAAVIGKKQSSEDGRKFLFSTARRFVIGMGMAKKRHASWPDNVFEEFDGRFVAGEFDKELAQCTQPAMMGPSYSWIRKTDKDISQKEKSQKQSQMDQAAADAVSADQAAKIASVEADGAKAGEAATATVEAKFGILQAYQAKFGEAIDVPPPAETTTQPVAKAKKFNDPLPPA